MPAPAAPRPKGFDLKRKVGPLPVWGWSLIGIAGTFVVIRYVRAAKAAKAASTSTTTAVPASSSPYNGLGAGIGGGYGGGFGGSFGGGGSQPWTTTPSPEPASTLRTPEGNTPIIPVASPLLAPAPVPIPTPEGMARALQVAGIGSNLSPAQANALSVLYQPQNQPGVNPNVSSAPVTQLQEGGSVAPASGVGTRYVTPGPAPYAFTFG